MLNPLKLLDVLRFGHEFVDDLKARKWTAAGVAAGSVLFSIGQVLKAFNVDIPLLSHDACMQLGVGIGTLAGVFGTYGTSKDMGLLPAKDSAAVPANPLPDITGHLDPVPAPDAAGVQPVVTPTHPANVDDRSWA